MKSMNPGPRGWHRKQKQKYKLLAVEGGRCEMAAKNHKTNNYLLILWTFHGHKLLLLKDTAKEDPVNV